MSVNESSENWRLATVGQIPLKVVDRRGSFGEEGASCTEVFIIRANMLASFVAESFPEPVLYRTGLRYPRRRYVNGFPMMTNRSISWESNVSGLPIDPFGSDPSASSGTYCQDVRVTVEYTTSPANDEEPDPEDPKTYLTISASASGTFLNHPVPGSAVWRKNLAQGEESDVVVKDYQVPNTISEAETEWSVAWAQIPHSFFTTTLMNRLRSKLGKVNDAAMSVFYDAPADTILFLGYSLTRQNTWRSGKRGQSPLKLDMKFLEKSFVDNEGQRVSHNYFYRPSDGKYRVLLLNGKPAFESTNLTEIFKA